MHLNLPVIWRHEPDQGGVGDVRHDQGLSDHVRCKIDKSTFWKMEGPRERLGRRRFREKEISRTLAVQKRDVIRGKAVINIKIKICLTFTLFFTVKHFLRLYFVSGALEVFQVTTVKVSS